MGGGGSVTFPGGGIDLLGGLCGPMPGGHLIPCLTDLVGLLPQPAWVDLREWGELLPSLCGRREIAWVELLPSLEGRRTVAWEEL